MCRLALVVALLGVPALSTSVMPWAASGSAAIIVRVLALLATLHREVVVLD